MNLGEVALDGFVASHTSTTTSSGFVSLAASGFLKQERPATTTEDHTWRTSKLSKTQDDISTSKEILFHHRNDNMLRSHATLFSEPQMLSFSTQKSEPLLPDKTPPNATFPYSFHPLSSYNKNTGYNSSGNMHGIIPGSRGLFTPSQWMELEHQALIYKYITANVPVPSHLLIPIKKALESAGFGILRPSSAMGWGGFHLGFSSNTDPEPGRCRRTDGKKWRCSRDAVVDQKYCERHMNRGRHRSRKPVEVTGTTNNNVTNSTNINTTASSKLVSSNNNNNVVVPGSTTSNSLNFAQQEPKNMHPLASDAPLPNNNINRMIMSNKENGNERIHDTDTLPMLPATLDLKPKESPFLIHKNHVSYEESSRNEFGLVTSDSLLNPSHKSSTLLSSRTTTQEPDSQHSLRHFIDDWPKTHSNRSGVTWPELDMQSERTELSISTPMTASDFMSSTSSPSNDKVTLSPLRLSRELDPIQMGLGVGNAFNEPNINCSRQANWIPIAWESSMGGPLGEVLNLSNNNNTIDQCVKNKNGLNLMSDGWDNSPPLGSSPTGVLQKTAFGSLSNSSAGSSPRAENNKTQEGASLCNVLLGSTLGNSTL